MRLKQKQKQPTTEPAEEAPIVNPFKPDQLPQKQEKHEELLKQTAEKIIEEILLGTRLPTQGMELDIKLNGKFTIFGFESTKDSYFRYVYPQKNNGEAPQETVHPEAANKKHEQPKQETEEELIYLD